MKKILCLLVGLLLVLQPAYSVNYWQEGTGQDSILGSISPSDIDKDSFENVVAPLDRLLSDYREGCKLSYASAATLTVGTGQVVCDNAARTIRKFRENTSATTVAWTAIDTGSEAVSTTYYIYALADAAAATFTVTISLSSSAPTGGTNFKRLGSFYNNADGNIEQIVNDGDEVTGDQLIRARINFNSSGTIAINDSYNVTSITDNGTGNFTITWDTDFSNANYSPVGIAGNTAANISLTVNIRAIAVGTVQLLLFNEDGTATDGNIVSVISVGDQ